MLAARKTSDSRQTERIGSAVEQRENRKMGTEGLWATKTARDTHKANVHFWVLGPRNMETTQNSGLDQGDSANVFNGFKKRAK